MSAFSMRLTGARIASVFSAIFVAAWASAAMAQDEPAPTPTPTLITSVVNTRAVGGVSINPEGILDNVTTNDRDALRKAREQALAQVPADMKAAGLRKISLARLEAAARDAAAAGRPLPDDIRYLAGLQRIQYVFVYPELKDIVLAGPGEGWRVNDEGTVVGVTTGQPVLTFDDLLVALRSTEAARQGGISCSIDPTPEGLQRNAAFMKRQRNVNNPATIVPDYEQSLGPQMITVTGVPATSHFARVLVAADYRMKRLAMKFDEPPVRGLPSYMDMLAQASGTPSTLPRWWMAAHYEPLSKDAEGLAWELRGQGVKAMAEDDFFSDGTRQKSVKASPLVQKWADNMTDKYEALAAKETIFAELRNCMDLSVVTALIARENLAAKAGLKLALLMDAKKLPTEVYSAPKQVASKASFVRKGNGFLISGSGGVQILSWQVAEKQTASDKLAPAREKASPSGAKWWWN